MAFSRAIRRLASTVPSVTLKKEAFAAVSRRSVAQSAAQSAATRTTREARLPANGETSLWERLRWESEYIRHWRYGSLAVLPSHGSRSSIPFEVKALISAASTPRCATPRPTSRPRSTSRTNRRFRRASLQRPKRRRRVRRRGHRCLPAAFQRPHRVQACPRPHLPQAGPA